MHYRVEYHFTRLICCTLEFQSSKNQLRVFLVYLDSSCIKSIKKNTNKRTLAKTKDKLSYNRL